MKRSLVEGLLWLWIAAGFAVYLIQFRDMAGPVLQLLGTQP